MKRFPSVSRKRLCWTLALLGLGLGCATPGLMKQWERHEQRAAESDHFVVFVDKGIPLSVGREVLSGLEFARDRVGKAFNFYHDEKIVCNLYQDERKLRNVCVGLPLGFVVPRRAPLAYVLGGEVHGRLYTTPSGNVSRLWASTFPHEYCHVMFKEVTGRQYFQHSWLQEGIGEYFRRLYLQETVRQPEFKPGLEEHFLLDSNPPQPPPDDDPLALRDRTYGIMSYTDWEVRNALRYDQLVEARKLNPKTFLGYWRRFNTPRANQIYAISSSLVEYLVNEHGWRKMRELLAALKTTKDLDEAMQTVYGFDQNGLDERWRLHLRERWPDPWQPNIAMVYLVRGNWEVDGHEAGIRTALAENNLEAAQRHQFYLNRRSVTSGEPAVIAPLTHSKRFENAAPESDGFAAGGLDMEGPIIRLPDGAEVSPPAIEHYETAMAAYSIGRFAEGVEHLSRALEIEPEQLAPLRVHLARGYWLSGEKQKALALYEDELLENDEMAFVNEAAWCFELAGDTRRAIDLYKLIADSADVPKLREHARRRIDRLSQSTAQSNGLSLPSQSSVY